MNPSFLGDSYDLVKRFFCHELSLLGYCVSVDPMFTGDWGDNVQNFYRLVGAQPLEHARRSASRTALFLDPDTGIKETGSKQHVSFNRLAHETMQYDLVFSFDQSFSFHAKPKDVMREKLTMLRQLGCHGLYYDSHARFLFLARQQSVLDELKGKLQSIGLPSSRFLTGEA